MATEPEQNPRNGGSLFSHGVVAGVVGGTIFAIAEIIASMLTGGAPLAPLKLIASVVLGRAALDVETPIALVLMVALFAHYLISVGWGVVYSGLMGTMSQQARFKFGFESFVGVVFGTAVWLVNFHLIGRAMYPWFLETSQPQQWLLHALFYGLPLGAAFAGLERTRPSQPIPIGE